ncbi:hypothetical protein P5V15_001599 [Pogonomyrmex californicus]
MWKIIVHSQRGYACRGPPSAMLLRSRQLGHGHGHGHGHGPLFAVSPHSLSLSLSLPSSLPLPLFLSPCVCVFSTPVSEPAARAFSRPLVQRRVHGVYAPEKRRGTNAENYVRLEPKRSAESEKSIGVSLALFLFLPRRRVSSAKQRERGRERGIFEDDSFAFPNTSRKKNISSSDSKYMWICTFVKVYMYTS